MQARRRAAVIFGEFLSTTRVRHAGGGRRA
jgi:hypothetical protein